MQPKDYLGDSVYADFDGKDWVHRKNGRKVVVLWRGVIAVGWRYKGAKRVRESSYKNFFRRFKETNTNKQQH